MHVSEAKRTKYTKQFKQLVIERASKESVRQVAKDLKISEATIYAWRSAEKHTRPVLESQKLADAEVSRLRRALSKAEEELSFLKKAAAYFAKDKA